MKKLHIILMFMLGVCPLFASQHNIDFTRKSFSDPFRGRVNYEIWKDAFNSAPEFGPFIISLKDRFHISTAVETGTWEQGRTAKFFSLIFDQVHTVEIDPTLFQRASANLQNFKNVTCYLGSSDKVLEEILPALKNEPVLFYLDAHWYEPWPLLDELEAISITHKDNCIVVIDDFKVPGRPDIAYDSYGSCECSLEYIQNKLNKIYSEYDYFYLIPKNINSRAKFLALPKKWGFKP